MNSLLENKEVEINYISTNQNCYMTYVHTSPIQSGWVSKLGCPINVWTIFLGSDFAFFFGITVRRTIPNLSKFYHLKQVILVGGLEHFLFFHSVGNVVIPTDFHIFQRGGSTTNQYSF